MDLVVGLKLGPKFGPLPSQPGIENDKNALSK